MNDSNIRKIIIDPPDFSKVDLGVCRTRSPLGLELYYNLVMDQSGISFPDHLRPVACALADDNIKQLMIIVSPGSGKSMFMSVVYPSWELGLDFTQTILGISAAEALITGFMQATMSIIEHNKIYKNLFPNSVPDKDKGWSPFRGMFLKRRLSGMPDPSYLAAGVESRLVVGKHARILIGDDLHDELNSQTIPQVDKLFDFFIRTFIGRQDPRGARMILVGRRWSPDDIYHRLEASGNWLVMTLPAIRELANETSPNLYWDVVIPGNLPCIFNDFTPKPAVEKVQIYYGYDSGGFYWPGVVTKINEARLAQHTKPNIFQTVYQCQPEHSDIAVFRESDFAFYVPPTGIELGKSSPMVCAMTAKADLVVQSWDTAFTAETKSDYSVCYSAALVPCSQSHVGGTDPIELHYDVFVLDEFRRQLEFADLSSAAKELYELWEPDIILVEQATTGIPLIQSLEKIAAPVRGVKVQNVSKRQRAINGASVGSAQGWMRLGRVKFPLDQPWFPDAKREILSFTGLKGQQDDRVDALVQIINFAIDLGLTAHELPKGWRTEAEIDERTLGTKPQNQLERLFNGTNMYFNPRYGTCQTCVSFDNNYCKLHKIAVSQLHSCINYEACDGVNQWEQLNQKKTPNNS